VDAKSLALAVQDYNQGKGKKVMMYDPETNEVWCDCFTDAHDNIQYQDLAIQLFTGFNLEQTSIEQTAQALEEIYSDLSDTLKKDYGG
jgi:hypothetical protein